MPLPDPIDRAVAILTRPSPVWCSACKERDDAQVRMEDTELWHAGLAATVSAWECPECGRAIVREEAGEVIWHDGAGESSAWREL